MLKQMHLVCVKRVAVRGQELLQTSLQHPFELLFEPHEALVLKEAGLGRHWRRTATAGAAEGGEILFELALRGGDG